MDTVEVTFHLERPVAERLRDPGDLARYEAFLGLVAKATTEREVAAAVALFARASEMRSRSLKLTFAEARLKAFGLLFAGPWTRAGTSLHRLRR